MSEVFGRYHLQEQIGVGSLGEVFRATHQSETVALKRLNANHHGNPAILEAFARETHIAKRLKHPRLLGALDSGTIENRPFYTTKLATGGSLEDRLSNSVPVPLGELAAMATMLGEAVQAMHDSGYCHGDLQPGNVLFTESTNLVLSDFGAATLLGQSQAPPRGTYIYMSPEQVQGRPLSVRSDVFSVATVLWQCLSGQKIFARAEQFLSIVAIVESSPPSLPLEMTALESVLRPALSKQPADRPGSVQALCEAFANSIDSNPDLS